MKSIGYNYFSEIVKSNADKTIKKMKDLENRGELDNHTKYRLLEQIAMSGIPPMSARYMSPW